MDAPFCCSSIQPYRPQRLDHEDRFNNFLQWTSSPISAGGDSSLVDKAPYAVQLVKQVNYGPQESIRYFFPTKDGSRFMEANENDLIDANFEKLNSYITIIVVSQDQYCTNYAIIGTRTLDAKSIINSLRSTCIREIQRINIIGGRL